MGAASVAVLRAFVVKIDKLSTEFAVVFLECVFAVCGGGFHNWYLVIDSSDKSQPICSRAKVNNYFCTR